MKYKSPIFSQASGSLAGTTFSRNKGGQYTRARAIPINPNTPEQAAVRNLFGTLADLWINTLTGAQRDAWQTYANNVQLIDRLGEPININALSMYQRSNTPILQAGLPRVDDGPTVFDLPSFTQPSPVGIDTANDELDVTFTNTDAWAKEDDGAMLVYISRPQNATVNYFKGPYRFAGSILGDAMTPPTSPAAIPLPFPVVAGQRIFYKISVVRADGRLSTPFRGFALAP